MGPALIERLKARLEVVEDSWRKQLEIVANSPDIPEEIETRLNRLGKIGEICQRLHQIINFQEHQQKQRELQEKSAS